MQLKILSVNRLKMGLLFGSSMLLSPPAAANNKCVAANLANKGSYVLHMHSRGTNDRVCSHEDSISVSGAMEGGIDLLSGHRVIITGAFCPSSTAKCTYEFICSKEEPCEIVCDGFWPGNLGCARK